MANDKMVPWTFYAWKVSKGAARFRPAALGSNGNAALLPGCADAETPQLPTHRSRVRHSFREMRGKPQYYFISSQCYGSDGSAELAGELKDLYCKNPRTPQTDGLLARDDGPSACNPMPSPLTSAAAYMSSQAVSKLLTKGVEYHRMRHSLVVCLTVTRFMGSYYYHSLWPCSPSSNKSRRTVASFTNKGE